MSETKLKWGIRAYMLGAPHTWSLGVCLSHTCEETYLYFNLIFCNVSIGKMWLEVKDAD